MVYLAGTLFDLFQPSIWLAFGEWSLRPLAIVLCMAGKSYFLAICGVVGGGRAFVSWVPTVCKLRKQANIFGHPCHWLLVPTTSGSPYSDVDILHIFSQGSSYLLFSGGSKVQTDLFSV